MNNSIDINQAHQVLRLITDYGVAIVGLIFVVGFLGWLIRYILRTNEKREQKLSEFLTNDLRHLTEGLNILTTNITNFSNSTNEAQKYQREEHNKIIENSLNICSTLKNNTDCLDKVRENIEEQTKILAKINGKTV